MARQKEKLLNFFSKVAHKTKKKNKMWKKKKKKKNNQSGDEFIPDKTEKCWAVLKWL
jgi:hypothetical protein